MMKLKDLEMWIKKGGVKMEDLPTKKVQTYQPAKRSRIYSEQIAAESTNMAQ